MSLEAKGKTKAEFTAEILEFVDKGVQDIYNSERWKQWLSFNASFHSYSVKNRLLIFLQNPSARLVASMKKWNELGRNVIKGQGAEGIKIWAPTEFTMTVSEKKLDEDGKAIIDADTGDFVVEEKKEKTKGFIPVSVYDVSQTEGEPLPSLTVPLTAEVSDRDKILKCCEKISGVPIYFEDIKNSSFGYYYEEKNGEKKIVIKSGLKDAQTVKTAIHETAHALLDHIKDKTKDRSQKEIEAESIAFVVCKTLGIDTSDYSFGYLASWSSTKKLPELKQSIETIVDISDKVCREMKMYMQGFQLQKCAEPEAVKAYISKQDDFKIENSDLKDLNKKLLEVDNIASKNNGVFVEIYKSECPEFKAGSLLSLAEADSKLPLLDKLENANNIAVGLPKNYKKVYCTLYFPTRDEQGKIMSYNTVTQKHNVGVANGKTLSQTIATYSKSAEQLKGIINAEIKKPTYKKSKYRKR